MKKVWVLASLFCLPVWATEIKIPLVPGSFEARATVRINGQTLTFVVDTGASRSTLTPDALKTLGLGDLPADYSRARVADGRVVTSQVVRLQNIEFGEFTIPFMAASLASENLLGMDVLGRYRFILDVPNNQMTIQDPNTETLTVSEQAFSFPYNPRRLSIPVQVTLNDTPVNLLLDTGATTTTLSQRMVGALSLPVVGRTTNTVADGKVVNSKVVNIARLSAGNLTVNNLAASVIENAIGEQGRDGLLGYNFLSNFRLTLDPTTGRGYLVSP